MATQRSCPVIDNLVKSLTPKQRSFLGLTSKAAIQCLLAFLAFIVKSPTLFSQFKTFINGIMALIDLQVAAVQLLIAQIAVSLDIIGAIIAPFKALQSQISGFLGMMPFGEFLNCPPIAFLAKIPKQLMEGALSYISKVPPADKIKQVLAFIKMLQWRLEKLEKFKKDLLDTLEQLKSIKLLLKAMMDAIEQCFDDLKFPSPAP